MLKHFIQLAARTIVAMVLSCGLTKTAEALPFNQISKLYFFGDSFTDSGFNDLWDTSPLGPLPAGKAPIFTTFNGYTWAQYVARDIKNIILPIYSPGTYIPSPADTLTNNTTPLNGTGRMARVLSQLS